MTDTIFTSIPKKHREAVLEEILDVYVERQGLGAIPKGDFDALLVYLFSKYAAQGEFDSFDLSERFRVSESRIKSLIKVGSLKFDDLTEGAAWVQIGASISTALFELDSLEKAQIRFKLHDPTLHRFLQRRVRMHEGTMTYSSSSEAATVTLSTLFTVLDDIYVSSQTDFKSTEMDKIRPGIEKTITRIGETLGKQKMAQLLTGELKTTKLGKALGTASKLAGIGGLILALA